MTIGIVVDTSGNGSSNGNGHNGSNGNGHGNGVNDYGLNGLRMQMEDAFDNLYNSRFSRDGTMGALLYGIGQIIIKNIERFPDACEGYQLRLNEFLEFRPIVIRRNIPKSKEDRGRGRTYPTSFLS